MAGHTASASRLNKLPKLYTSAACTGEMDCARGKGRPADRNVLWMRATSGDALLDWAARFFNPLSQPAWVRC
eukprot:1160422-Pelagomonas_calceolata.AAC.5